MSRPLLFDDAKRRELCAMIRVGCSRRAAAEHVGVAPTTVYKTAERDPEFRKMLRRAEAAREVVLVNNIQAASTKSWRAAAWLLKRISPVDYVAPIRDRHCEPADAWNRTLTLVLDTVEELTSPEIAARIRDRINELLEMDDTEMAAAYTSLLNKKQNAEWAHVDTPLPYDITNDDLPDDDIDESSHDDPPTAEETQTLIPTGLNSITNYQSSDTRPPDTLCFSTDSGPRTTDMHHSHLSEP